MKDKKTKIKKTLNLLIQLVIIVVTYSFIYRQVFHERDLSEIYDELMRLGASREFRLQIALILLLMLVNWGIESWKWQLLITKIEKITFFKSYKAVLTGVSVSTFLPNRIGEYFGRVFILRHANPLEGILITIIGSMSQLLVTVIAGLFGSLYVVPTLVRIDHALINYIYFGMMVAVPIVAFILLIIYFNIGILADFFERFLRGSLSKYSDHLSAFRRYSGKELFHVLLLSLLRYGVFTFQFYLLLEFVGITIPFLTAVLIISTIYLVITVLPTVALTSLGIRGSVSLVIIGLYLKFAGIPTESAAIGILTVSTLIWLINLIIPAIIGTFFVFQLKFFRK